MHAKSKPSAILVGWMPLSSNDSACSNKAPARTKCLKIYKANINKFKKKKNSYKKLKICKNLLLYQYINSL